MSERDWIEGYRAAYASALQSAIAGLVTFDEADRPPREMLGREINLDAARLLMEREEVRRQLRDLCERLDCNDWSDDLHLGDVVDKYLSRRIDELLPEVSR